MQKLPFDPVILSYARTPFGKYNGALSSIRPDDLLVHALKHALERSYVDMSLINEVIAGAANQSGEDNRNVARMASLLLGLDVKIPGITINRLCSSSLDALIEGARRIMTGEQKLVLIGGVESMSRAPYVLQKNAPIIHDTSLGWRFYNEKLSAITPPEKNGETADRLSHMFDISRKAQDEYALNSHKRAMNTGFFNNEIAPILNIARDEGPRENSTLEALSLLKPAFSKDGTVTAGNSSPLSDGACGMVICSYEYAKAHGLRPLGRVLGFASAGVDPKLMGLGPVPATKKLCEKFGFSLKDFSLIEINEAFAVQVLSVIKELNIDINNVNTNGGAIAIGHPLGASGLRIAMTLVNNLRAQNKTLGLATMCVGVGQGVSLALEAI